MKAIGRFPLAAFAVALVATLLAFAPALSSQLVGDDWGLLALARHLRHPWDFYRFDHSSSYFYRPNAMVLWWLSTRAFGANASAHMMLNALLHALNAALLAMMTARATRRPALALLAAALFALHPLAIGTSLWLADRFDLLATGAVLAALIALDRAIAGESRLRWVAFAALVAAGAKETAIVLVPVAALRLLLARDRAWRWRFGAIAAVTAPFVAMLIARASLLQGIETTLAIRDLVASALTGIGFWLARLPAALAGARTVSETVFLAGGVTFAVAAWLATPRETRRATWPVLAVAAALAIAPALVQWPVTQAVLGTPESIDNPVNLRFYYLTACGIALALAALVAPMLDKRAARAALGFVALAAVVAWLPGSRERATTWATRTSGEEHALNDAALAALADGEYAPGCRVHLRVEESTYSTFGGFVDAAVKAQLPRRHPLLACTVLLESRVPYYSITAGLPCEDAAFAPLAPRVVAGKTFTARRIGNLCYHYFDQPAPAFPGTPGVDRWFGWDGSAFRPISPLR